MKRKYIFLFFGLFITQAYSQNRVIKNYYDAEKSQIKEMYRVLDTDTTILDGMYKTYYQNGKIKTIGFYTKGQATDYWEYFYQNGNVKMEGIINNFFNQGHWIFYYENGNKSMEGNMDKGKKNGYWRFYNEDGKLKSEGMLKEGKNDGEWKYYYDEGEVKATGNYKNGVGFYREYFADGNVKMEGKIKMGKSDSIWNYYHSNGKLKATGIETNGLKEGKWKFFFENGNQASEGNYQKGETVGEWKYFDEDGSLSSVGNEKNGQKEGQWKMFYSNGKPKGNGSFSDGNGSYTEYYENGNIKLKGNFKRGKYDGLWEYFYDDGKKEGECLYSNNEGWYIGYYPDGNKKMEGLLKDGNKSGVWKLYKKDGNIAGYYKTYYEDNELPKNGASSQAITSNNSTRRNKQTKPFFPKIRLYRPDPNVYKTFIFSIDPLQLILGSLPFFLEYYVQEKWGLEISFAYNKNPFFKKLETLPIQQVYQTGASYSVRYKKYFSNSEFIGRPYIGGEYRYKDLDYNFNAVEENIPKVISATEHAHEAILLLGDRFMKKFDKKGFTFDLYLGIGIGYKSVSKNYIPQADYDATFKNILKNGIYVPFRFGVSVGYAF
jgi:antitoxin component YwqK of YwqJK toxin-antitoxin module